MTKLTYKLSAIITRQFALVFCLCVCITAQASRQHSQHSQQHGSHHVQHHPQKHLKGSNGTHLQHAYVAFCAIMRNEHLNVAEWIQYHAWLGVEKFYIFDHGSKPPISVVLQEYVEQGIVEVFHFQNSWQVDAHQFGEMYKTPVRQFLSPQGWAYDNCYRYAACLLGVLAARSMPARGEDEEACVHAS